MLDQGFLSPVNFMAATSVPCVAVRATGAIANIINIYVPRIATKTLHHELRRGQFSDGYWDWGETCLRSIGAVTSGTGWTELRVWEVGRWDHNRGINEYKYIRFR